MLSLFEAIMRSFGEKGLDDLAWLAMEPYLDALGMHLDGGYLQAQVGLEAFCSAVGVASTGKTQLLVADAGEFDGWIKLHESQLRGLAPDATLADALMHKVRSAKYAGTGNVVAEYFSDQGVTLPTEYGKEIKLRNRVAHTLLMGRPGTRDVHRDLARIALIQTLLVGALSLYVGHVGPIAEGTRATKEAEWWPNSGLEPHRVEVRAGEE